MGDTKVRISGSVGRNGKNDTTDVRTIQNLINQSLPIPLRPLDSDGKCGPLTIGAIEEIQRRNLRMREPDGRVDPNGATFHFLTSHAKNGRDSFQIEAKLGPITLEPIRDTHSHQISVPSPSGSPLGQQSRPPNIDALVARIQHDFPNAHIRITGRGRTVQRQAELMEERRVANRSQFLHVYLPARHITEMDTWVTNHPDASEDDTVAAFVDIINRARQRGAVVSNHLSDRARDISIPQGGRDFRNQIRSRFQQLGAHVIDEHGATGGPHWHIDY
jgi:hypothetical protein